MLKTLLKNCGWLLKRHWKDVVECFVIGVLFIGFFVFGMIQMRANDIQEISFWKRLVTEPEPDKCALCDNTELRSYQAPGLVNLATGEVGELQVYNKHPYREGDIAETQPSGTLHLFSCAGLVGTRDPGNHQSRLLLSDEVEAMSARYFCYKCRRVLAEVSTEGYVILDVHGTNIEQVYPVEKGMCYTVGEYSVYMFYDNQVNATYIDTIGH